MGFQKGLIIYAYGSHRRRRNMRSDLHLGGDAQPHLVEHGPHNRSLMAVPHDHPFPAPQWENIKEEGNIKQIKVLNKKMMC